MEVRTVSLPGRESTLLTGRYFRKTHLKFYRDLTIPERQRERRWERQSLLFFGSCDLTVPLRRPRVTSTNSRETRWQKPINSVKDREFRKTSKTTRQGTWRSPYLVWENRVVSGLTIRTPYPFLGDGEKTHHPFRVSYDYCERFL